MDGEHRVSISKPPREQISIQALSLLMSRSQKKMHSDCISPERVIFSPFFSLASLPSTKAACLGLLGSEANSSITGRKRKTPQPRQYKPTYQPIPASPGLTWMLRRVKKANLFSKNWLYNQNINDRRNQPQYKRLSASRGAGPEIEDAPLLTTMPAY